jgi:hypothetical protein
LDRVFIMGVAPLVLSDMTSGYNVAENISLQLLFHAGPNREMVAHA